MNLAAELGKIDAHRTWWYVLYRNVVLAEGTDLTVFRKFQTLRWKS